MAINPFDKLRKAIQDILDASDSEGWELAHYVVVVGIERLTSDGKVQTAVWAAQPGDQADYITDGLLASAEDIRASADVEDD
jgi:hypothetical protein